MIETIKIQGCQSLKNIQIDLGQITLLIGPTDSGKSAVLRALEAFFTNSYGDYLLRWNESSMKVSVDVDGIKDVGFIKGDKPCYFIGDEKFYKVGTDVPDKIRNIIKLESIHFDKDISYFLPIQGQFQSEFLVNEYGGVASKVLGKLTNLGIVYIARRRAFSESNIVKTRQKVSEQAEVELSTDLAIVKDKKVELLSSEIEYLLSNAKKVEQELNCLNLLLLTAEEVLKLREFNISLVKVEQLLSECDSVSEKLSDIDSIVGVVEEFDCQHQKYNTSSCDMVFDFISKIESSALTTLEIDDFIRLSDSLEKFSIEFNQINKELSVATEEVLDTIKLMDVCPTCLQSLSIEAKESLSRL